MSGSSYFASANEQAAASYIKTLARIKTIVDETEKSGDKTVEDRCRRFFHLTGRMVLNMAELTERTAGDEWWNGKLEDLQEINNAFFAEIRPDRYKGSYANPTFCVGEFGEELGRLMTCFYLAYRHYYEYALVGKIFRMKENNEVLIDAYDIVQSKGADYPALQTVITRLDRHETAESINWDVVEHYDPKFDYYKSIIDTADLSDKRYLYRYPACITEHEIATVDFLAAYPEEKINQLSDLVVKAYIRGFELDGKDVSKKSAVMVIYRVGQERLIKRLCEDLKKTGLNAALSVVDSTEINRQYPYDHRFDIALHLDDAFVKENLATQEKAYSKAASFLSAHSGVIFFEAFGEAPFSPENKKENITLSEAQQKNFQEMNSGKMQLRNRFTPRDETSFCIIALPTPEIGDRFEKIFEDTMEINMLDPNLYTGIQQKMIDALDKADHVHIKGKTGNRTDLKVKIAKIKNPKKETAFVNCGADVNIPVGEVFTSPVLKGTNGVLHIPHTFLEELKYVDLELTFKDGYIADYSCANFKTKEENRKYIEENLMFPHKTLPMGEFAIGTNTLAYVIAEKYDIMNILPILIVEKMGPHFAVGDTCFSHEEDRETFNPDGKKIIAKDNDKTILRKEDVNKAYTQCHTDITLPYEGIEFIASITPDGKAIDIIRDGRFVLAGTEELNKPFG